MSERRQLRILMRASLDRLMDTALASRGIDAPQFAIWTYALIATPTIVFAFRLTKTYTLGWLQPEVLERAALAHRLFFIVYSMLAAAFIAAKLWEALFPDRQDQEILGVLPVRPRTIAGARLIAALGIAVVFSIALAIPSGFLYMTSVAAAYRRVAFLAWPPAVFVAHVTTLSLAGIFTFALLVALRGMAVTIVGAAAAQRAAAFLQLVTIVLLIEALIFLPGVLDALVGEIVTGKVNRWLPPLWFMGLYTAISGPASARLPDLAGAAVAATAAAVLLAGAAYLGPAAWNARRTLEGKLKHRKGRSLALVQRLAAPWLREPTARAVFTFTLASLSRSRRHALTVVTYLAAAVALSAVRFTSAYVRDLGIPVSAPADYMLALPLVMTFFLVVALHAAFGVPTGIESNWTFRVAHPRSTEACVHGLRIALAALAVLPVTLVWVVIALSLWSWWQAAAAAAMHAASGMALIELTLIGRRSIPFTRAHAADVQGVRARWILVVFALHLFAFRLDDVQLAALRTAYGPLLYIGAMALVFWFAGALRRAQSRESRLEFEAPSPDAAATLNLSQAHG